MTRVLKNQTYADDHVLRQGTRRPKNSPDGLGILQGLKEKLVILLLTGNVFGKLKIYFPLRSFDLQAVVLYMDLDAG
jgi:hypothetical protein